jgi:hypothetical protein
MDNILTSRNYVCVLLIILNRLLYIFGTDDTSKNRTSDYLLIVAFIFWFRVYEICRNETTLLHDNETTIISTYTTLSSFVLFNYSLQFSLTKCSCSLWKKLTINLVKQI